MVFSLNYLSGKTTHLNNVMAETIANFHSQLSGVMETVFKAAIFEITRLVEDSFLEEMNRCREQVESLKKRLKRSESGDGRGRCKDCGGRRGVTGEEDTGESVRFILPFHSSMHHIFKKKISTFKMVHQK